MLINSFLHFTGNLAVGLTGLCLLLNLWRLLLLLLAQAPDLVHQTEESAPQ